MKLTKIFIGVGIALILGSNSTRGTSYKVLFNQPKTSDLILTPRMLSYSLLQSVSMPSLQGILYQGFGINKGTSYIPFNIVPGWVTNQARAIALQQDGKIVLGGWSGDGAANSRYSVARFLTDGSLDTSFGQVGTAQAGAAYVNFPIIAGGTSNIASSMALQSDGKIVLAGWSIAGGNSRYAVARFLTDGSLDTSFGQVGTPRAGTAYVSFSIAGNNGDQANAIALQPDGKIVLAGWSKASGVFRYAVARFLTDGSLDTSFGRVGTTQAGTAYISFSITGEINDYCYAIALQPDGKIVLGGHSRNLAGNDRYTVARFLADGSLDTSFGQVGTARAGTAYVNFYIARGTDDEAHAIALQPDGKIVLGGFSDAGGGNTRYSVARFLTDGSLDTNFGQVGTARAGTTYVNFSIAGGNTDEAHTMALQPDGKIVLAGRSSIDGGNTRYSVARFLVDGSLDMSFGQTGIARAGTAYVNFPIAGGDNDRAFGIALQSDGKIVLGGSSENPDGNNRCSVAQFIGGYALGTYLLEYPTQGGFY